MHLYPFLTLDLTLALAFSLTLTPRAYARVYLLT